MTKIVNTNEETREVEILTSKFDDSLKRLASSCNHDEIKQVSFIRYKVYFKTCSDMRAFVSGIKATT